jgi:hypothetical protein
MTAVFPEYWSPRSTILYLILLPTVKEDMLIDYDYKEGREFDYYSTNMTVF